MLGARPLPDVVAHARHFVRALAATTGRVIDLGSGGGVPGLVVAWDRPDLRVTLVDRRSKRTDHLQRLTGRLQLSDRVQVVCGDVAALGGTASHRHAYDAVTCRGLGPPDLTLRWAAPFVSPNGVIVISEPPPGAADRWSAELLAGVGLVRVPSADSTVAVLRPRG